MTAYVLTALTGKRIKAKHLLPEVFPFEPIVYTPEEHQKELDDIKREVGLLN